MRVALAITCFAIACSALIVATRAADVAAPTATPDRETTASDNADAQPRGIVSVKPTSGPFVETDQGYMVPYRQRIGNTDVVVEMIPVPGGVFTFGSSPDEENRGELELDAVKVKLPPFWVSKYEITWAAYWEYMRLNNDFAALETVKTLLASKDPKKAEAAQGIISALPCLAEAVASDVTYVDGVTAPTPLYDESTTYECGKDPNQPAATMTPFAAKQFTKWLSGISGVHYRLPTEAEWEYAARAGTTTAYPFGDDPDELGEYAWYEDNADWVSHPVGQKKPNAWGLYDMIGNVAEWVIDEYKEDLERSADEPLSWEQAVNWPTSSAGRIVRGGFYDSPAEECRSTSRFYSEDLNWKASDPNAPLSPWWYTDYPATGVGMRVVRSLEPLSPELAQRFWDFNSDDTKVDVESRIVGGRGKLGPANADLPQVQAELEDDSVKSLLHSGR